MLLQLIWKVHSVMNKTLVPSRVERLRFESARGFYVLTKQFHHDYLRKAFNHYHINVLFVAVVIFYSLHRKF